MQPVSACPHPVRPGMFMGAAAVGVVSLPHAGGSVRLLNLRTALNSSLQGGTEVSQSICTNCLNKFSAEIHIGVDLRDAKEGEPGISTAICEIGFTVSNTGVEFGPGLHDHCFGPCTEVAIRKSEPSGAERGVLAVQRDATATPTPPSPMTVGPQPNN
jgi:hypothetical protein